VGRRRPRGSVSSGSIRFRKWKKKTEPVVTARITALSRDIAVSEEMEYQHVHADLITAVRKMASDYGSEAFKLQGYIWFAQGVWYCKKHYTSKTLVKCAIAPFIDAKLRDLNEELLRKIGFYLGVVIPDWDTILKEYIKPNLIIAKVVWGYPMVTLGTLMPVYVQAEKEGLTITMKVKKPDGTEFTTVMEDVGGGNYKADTYFDVKGAWVLEAIYPDGRIVKKEVVVS